jgi:hypothetical protein
VTVALIALEVWSLRARRRRAEREVARQARIDRERDSQP